MKRILGFAAALLCCFAIPISAISAPAHAAAFGTYNFSRKGDVTQSMDAGSLLSRYLETTGEAPTGFEREYLKTHAALQVLYSDGVDPTFLQAGLTGDVLTLTARPYTFRTVGQIDFTWTPETVNGVPMSESGGQYTYSTDVSGYEGNSVDVVFSSPVTIAQKDINAILNLTYEAGQAALASIRDRHAAYEEALAAYEAQCTAYEAYCAAAAQYELDSQARKAYLAAYNEWARKNADYQSYLQALANYEKEKAEYDVYDFEAAKQQYNEQLAAYNQYKADLAQYEKDLQQYKADTASPAAQTELYQLSILKYMTTPMTDRKRTVANAIMGQSVTQVLDAFAAAGDLTGIMGINIKAVENANAATIELRKLIPLYQACTSDEGRYYFYIQYHDSLRDNFCELFRSLDYLYHEFGDVRNAIESYHRTEEYKILLAQLYEISLALSDEKVENFYRAHTYQTSKWAYYDASYAVGPSGEKRKPAAILGENSLADLDNAAPLAGGYFTLPDEPELPKPVEHPGAFPQPMREPIAPAPVDDPGDAPAFVEEPVRPTPVDAPDKQPEEQLPTADERAFAEAEAGGQLPAAARPLSGGDFTFELKTSVTKYFRDAPVIDSITFHDADSSVICVLRNIEMGSYVSCEQIPVKTRTGYDCVFTGWADEEGNLVDLNRIQSDKSDLDLYPVYRETPKLYEVVWVVGNAYFYGESAYNTAPVYDEAAFGVPTMSDGTPRLFKFTGWNAQDGTFYKAGEQLPLTEGGGAVFTAQFAGSYLVTWTVEGRRTRTPYWEGETPDYGGTPEKARDAVYTYNFKGWTEGGRLLRELPAVTADVTYTASFEAVFLVDLGGYGAVVSEEEGNFVAACLGGGKLGAGALFALAAGENAGVVIRLSGCRLTFLAGAVYEAAAKGIESVSASVIQTGPCCYDFLLDLRGSEGVIADVGATFAATGVFDAENSYLVEETESGEQDVRFVTENNTVTFTAYAGRNYTISPQYFVNIIASDEISVAADRVRVRAGEKISVTVGEPAEGMHLVSLYAVGADGTEYAVTDGAVRMPQGGISIGAICAWNVYTVVFRSEGRVLSTRTYRHGDPIAAPDGTPVKVSDDTYSYTFTGWDGELGPATGDAVYNAVFTAEPLPPAAPQQPSKVVVLIRIAKVAVPVFCVVLVAAIVLIVVLVRRKKRKKAQNAAPMSEKDAPQTAQEAPQTAEEPSLAEGGAQAVAEAPAAENAQEPPQTAQEDAECVPSEAAQGPSAGEGATEDAAEGAIAEEDAGEEEGKGA